MVNREFNFMIGGEAGQGIQSISYILTKTLVRGGLHVLLSQDYESRIRGGHNFNQIKVSEKPIKAIADQVDILIALNMETLDIHRRDLSNNGVILCDSDEIKNVKREKKHLFHVPFKKIAKEKAGAEIFSNTVALGAALELVNFDLQILENILMEFFSRKGEDIVKKNIEAARAGAISVKEYKDNLKGELSPIEAQKRMLINGNEAVALAAVTAGCKFISAYPMSPSTGIMQYLIKKAQRYNIVVEQAEDEISAINMALGASFAGVRALTATSGGGFSLMVESLGLAGMTETPLVIIEAQRPGPATGLPTRTEQGDLEFVLHAAQGEFPRAILAPSDVEDAFFLTIKAFNWADKYQIPVIILTDQYIADCYQSIGKFNLSKVIVDRGELLTDEDAANIEGYQRHQFTDSGISPRGLPGQQNTLIVTDSDEHTEDGHITESSEVREGMVKKRLKKLDLLAKEIEKPRIYGPQKAELLFIGWGSTCGAIEEAVDKLQSEKYDINLLHITEIWPFPREAVSQAVKAAEEFFVVEGNATGQMAHLIRAEIGKEASDKILRFDGRPLTSQYIVDEFKGVHH